MMGLCQWDYGPGKLTCVNCGRVVHTTSRTAGVLCPKSSEPLMIPAPAPRGPGTQLKKLVSGWPLYIRATDNCPCNQHAAQMDAWGADECERRVDEIVGWLREEAKRRGLPFADIAGRLLVRRAIAKARQARPPADPELTR
jgi:hypothetical protein